MKIHLLFILLFTSLAYSQTGELTSSDVSDAGIREKINGEIERLGQKLLSETEAAELYAKRGTLYFAVRDYDKAIVDLDKAIALRAQDRAQAFFFRGISKNMTKKMYIPSGCQDLAQAKKLKYPTAIWENIALMCGDLN